MKRLYLIIIFSLLSSIIISGQDEKFDVDLGLTSGNRWASVNIGSLKFEELGECIAWGEEKKHTTHHYYHEAWLDYKFFVPEKKGFDKDGFITYERPYVIDIGKNISGTQYDAAKSRWGSPWQMPTVQDFEELMRECTIEYLNYRDVRGWKVTGRNGNWIFLPSDWPARTYWCADAYSTANAYVFCFSEVTKRHCKISWEEKCREYYIRPIIRRK